MKIKKQFLKLEEDLTEISIGLVRLIKPIPEYELFFMINQLNNFQFKRTADIKVEGEYFDYYFSRYQAYDKFSKNCFSFISNKSISSVEKKHKKNSFWMKQILNFY